MCRLTTRGWRTELPSWPGRDGIRIPEFGLAVRSCRGVAASGSVGSAVMDGVGITGDSIGVADTRRMAAADTTRGATLFITGAVSTGQEARAAVMVCAAEVDLMPATGQRTETLAGAVVLATVLAQGPDLSTETPRLREDTRHRTVKAVSDRAHLAATTMVDRPGATLREAAPAWARRMAAEVLAVVAAVRAPAVAEAMAAVGDDGNRSSCLLR